MLRSSQLVKEEVPGEPGNHFYFRQLTGKHRARAERKAFLDSMHDQTLLFAGISEDMVKVVRDAMSRKAEAAAKDEDAAVAGGKKAEPEKPPKLDPDIALLHGLVDWSGPNYAQLTSDGKPSEDAESVTGYRQLKCNEVNMDELSLETREWAVERVAAISFRPKSNGTASATS